MKRVYISPSLQEHNAYINGGTEEQWMNKVADVVVPLLKYNGFEVFRNIPTMTLAQAVADSNSKNVDIHFAIHSNAGGARGTEVFYKSTNGQRLASSVYKYLSALTPTSDRGVRLHTGLYELNNTIAVAALAEVMFHDNIDDAKFIVNHIQEIGECIAHGICDYFGVAFNKPSAVPQYPGYLIKIGMTGDVVKLIQTRLNLLGFNCGSVDGVFGNLSYNAVVAFQKSKGLVADGIVGSITWKALFY